MANYNIPKTGFFNNAFLTIDEIKITVDNLAVNRGYGAFDFFEIKNKKMFYGTRHIKRFLNTIKIMKLFIEYSRDEIIDIVQNIIKQNNTDNFYVKLFALPTKTNHDAETPCSLIIIPAEAPVYDSILYKQGAKLISKEYTRFLPEAKSTNYLPLVYWYDEMAHQKAVDILFCTESKISEASRSNIFYVKGDKFYTPGKGILKGITRSIVFDILKKNHFQLIEKETGYNELVSSDEIFLTSATKKIMPIVNIDNKVIGKGDPGEKTKEIMTAFNDLYETW